MSSLSGVTDREHRLRKGEESMGGGSRRSFAKRKRVEGGPQEIGMERPKGKRDDR